MKRPASENFYVSANEAGETGIRVRAGLAQPNVIKHSMRTPHRPSVDDVDRRLLAAIQHGLPLVPRPYAEVAVRLGLCEAEVVARLAYLKRTSVIRRFGVVVRHHELGYAANAMVVWDVPDDRVTEIGRRLAGFDFITLCYRRPRHLPQWRFNLYCMIHGKSRDEVLSHLEWTINHCGLQDLPHAVLFSRRRFKQRGAVYTADATVSGDPATPECDRLVPVAVSGNTKHIESVAKIMRAGAGER